MTCNSVKNVFGLITACQTYFNRPDKPFIESPLLFTIDSSGNCTWPKQVELKLRQVYTLPKTSQTIVIVYPYNIFTSKGNDIPTIRQMYEQLRNGQQLYIIVSNSLCDVNKAYKELTENLLLPFEQVQPLKFVDVLHSNSIDFSTCASSVPLPPPPYLCATLNIQSIILSACRFYVRNGGTLIFKSCSDRLFSWPIVYSDYYTNFENDIEPLLTSLKPSDNIVVVRGKIPSEYSLERKVMKYKAHGVFLVCEKDVFQFDAGFNQAINDFGNTHDASISKCLQKYICHINEPR